jgi:hypothetical protein
MAAGVPRTGWMASTFDAEKFLETVSRDRLGRLSDEDLSRLSHDELEEVEHLMRERLKSGRHDTK